MAEQINRPPRLFGQPQDQIRQIWDYLYRTADILNYRLEGIGSNDLTDAEREILRPIIKEQAQAPNEMVTMKNLIVQLARAQQQSGGRQGRKAAMVVLKTATYDINPGESVRLTNSDFGFSDPVGYTRAGIYGMSSGSRWLPICYAAIYDTGSNEYIMGIINPGDTARTGVTARMGILYLPSDSVTVTEEE